MAASRRLAYSTVAQCFDNLRKDQSTLHSDLQRLLSMHPVMQQTDFDVSLITSKSAAFTCLH